MKKFHDDEAATVGQELLGLALFCSGTVVLFGALWVGLYGLYGALFE